MLSSVGDWEGEHFAFEGAPAQQQPASVAIDYGADGPTATIPDAHLLFTAQFARAGDNLLLHGEDGRSFVVQDYFATDDRARLLSPEGAALSADVIAALAGPQTPGQYAQATATPPAAQAVGRVVQSGGDATIVRNGVAIAANTGDAILKGDVLQTVSGSLSVTFNDGSTLNLTANTRLVVNEFVYDPRGSANSQLLDLVQGSLTFISGEVAHTGNMSIGTPVATMGIRGTVGGVTTASDGTVNFYVSQSATGAVILDSQGRIIANVVQDGPLIIVRPIGPLQVLAEEVQKSPAQLALELAALQQIVSIQSVGQQIIQQYFQTDPNNPNPNPQSTDKPLTQIQISIQPNPSSSPDDSGNDDNGPPPPATATVTVTTITPEGTDLPTSDDPIIIDIPVDLPPLISGPLQLATNEDAALVFSVANENSISLFDSDTAVLKVTLTATNGVLTLNGTAGLTFSDGDGTGDETMTFSGSQAAINAALDGMTFKPDTNFAGEAGVILTASDGTNTVTSSTVAIAVNESVNSPPVIDDVSPSAAYTEGDQGTLLSPNLTLTDNDSPTLFSAVVKISSGFSYGDELTADTEGTNITAEYDSGTGLLRLSGSDTVAHYQQVLSSVRYSSFSDDPTEGDTNTSRTIEWQVGASFAGQTTYDAGQDLYDLAVGDLNDDGKSDLIVANFSNGEVSVLLGNGDGTFQPRTTYPAGGYVSSAAIADMNQDGKVDVIATNFYNNSVSVLLGNGDGTFQAPIAQSTGTYGYAVASADLNGDGNTDVVTANIYNSSVSVLLGNGDGTFQSQLNFNVESGPQAVAVLDLDGDGKLDIVAANAWTDSVSVLLGNGDGTFQSQTLFATDYGPRSILAADLNNDGAPDIVTANIESNSVSVLFGIGDGTFQNQVTYDTGQGPAGLALGDVDGDGKADLIVANSYDRSVSVLLGNGDGTFQDQSNNDATGYGANAIVAADLDGDGQLDIVTSNNWENSVSVLLGNGTNLSASQQTTVEVMAVNDAPVNELPESIDGSGLTVLGEFTLEQYLTDVPPPWELGWNNYQANILDWMQDYIADHAADYTAQASVIDHSNDSNPWGDFSGFSYWPSNLDEGGQYDRFFAHFSAQFFVNATDTYNFGYNADDGAVLLIDGELNTGGVQLTAGVHNLELFYYDFGGGAIVELSAVRSGGQYSLVGSSGTATSGADFTINGLAMDDGDAGDAQMRTTLSVEHGTLTVNSIGGATVTGSGTNTVVITGSQWQIDDTLRDDGNIVYRSASNFNGTDALTMTTADFGHTGTGGAQTTVSTLEINVNAAPVLSLAGGHLEDQFSSQAYDLNAGNVSWSGAWTEINDGANNATTGEIQIGSDPAVAGGNFRLVLTDLDTESGADDIVQRTADLTGLTSAVLTFDYRRAIPNGDAGDIVTVYASSDGTNFTAVGTIGATGNGSFVDVDYQRVSFDISSYISANTTVRFAIGDFADNGDVIYVDNVRIMPMQYVQNGDPLPISSLANRISDADGSQLLYASVKISNAQAGDVLSVIGSLPSGITATAYNTAAGVLTLYGLASLADYQTALAQVAFSNSTAYPGNLDRAIEVTVNDGGANSNVATVTIKVIDTDDPPVANNDNLDSGGAGFTGFTLNPDNGHWYKINSTSLTWADAQAAAIAAGGYLAAITSAGENAFIDNLRVAGGGQDLWIGASDAGTEGQWVWADGPEGGQQFWQGDDSGTALGYANWNGGEPNDSGGSEDAAHMQGGGVWNDAGAGGNLGSVIEASFFTEDATSIISAAALLGNDLDEGSLTINSVNDSNTHGIVTILENGDIQYVPDGDFNGADSFTYTVSDGENVSNTATVSFTVQGINDAPLFNIANAGLTHFSEVNGSNTLTGLAVTDVDAGVGDLFSFTATAGHGTVSFENAGNGVMVSGNGSATLTASGTLAGITAALSAGITYNEDESLPATDKVVATINDGHGGTDTLNFVFNVTDNPSGGVVSLTGTSGKDVILGTGFNDTLTGNGSADTFVFTASNGADVVTDFSGHAAGGQGDVIVLENFQYSSFAELQDSDAIHDIGQNGDHTTFIDLGDGDGITLAHVNPSELRAADFIFHQSTFFES